MGGGEGKGIEESKKQQRYTEMFTCVMWRNFSRAAVENSIIRDDSGKYNKTEHQDEHWKIQHNQKTQEAEIGLDASTKFP